MPGERIQRAPPGEGGRSSRAGTGQRSQKHNLGLFSLERLQGRRDNSPEQCVRGGCAERADRVFSAAWEGSFGVVLGHLVSFWEENPNGRVRKCQLCQWRLFGGFSQGLRGLARLGDRGGIVWGVPRPEIFEPTVPPQKFWGVNPAVIPTSSRTQPRIPELLGTERGSRSSPWGAPARVLTGQSCRGDTVTVSHCPCGRSCPCTLQDAGKKNPPNKTSGEGKSWHS